MGAGVVEQGFIRVLLTSLGLAATYVLTGLPGLLLAVPPGYATPIFVPAGLGMSAVLIFGSICLPGVVLGSLALNVLAGYMMSPRFGIPEVATSILIAAASALQAGVGAAVLRRAIGHPALLDQSRDLLRFLLLTPAICLTSATLSLGGMWAIGTIERTYLPLSWMSWWIGDTLGILVILPLMYAFFGEPRTLWHQRSPYVAVPMIAFFALFVVIFVRVRTWEADQSLIEFHMRSQHVADAVRTSLEQQTMFLEQLGAVFQTRKVALTSHDFEALVGRLPKRFPILEAVGWAPRVAAADRPAFELGQQENWPAFQIHERDAAGEIRRATARTYSYPLIFLQPLAGKQEEIGFDFASQQKKRDAIDASFESGEVAATDPIGAIRDTNDLKGTILLTYAIHGGPNGPGAILALLNIRALIEKLIAPSEAILNVQLVDLRDNHQIFNNLMAENNSPFFGTEFTFGARPYLLRTQPTRLYLIIHRGLESWAVLVVGVFATGLLGALLLFGTGHAHRIQRLVDERTSELQVANRRLGSEMVERERAEAALRQARHMEAIGKLTGGVAHDFNNLLQVVLGNLELLHRQLGDPRATRLLSTAQRAAEQGARLVASLLAFARRQMLQPEVVDANSLLREFSDLIKRAIGPSVELKLNSPSRPYCCRVDPAQFQSAILNLAINARDAMPNGGQLTIDLHVDDTDQSKMAGVKEFAPLRRLKISVRDNGRGMAPDVLDRAFEPFFTTKDVGQGSGLGLSQVYGFVEQSGGHVEITSTLGTGTEVSIYLPLLEQRGCFHIRSQMSRSNTDISSATILVVEDDPNVRRLMVDNLRELGYSVLSAADGQEAMSIFRGNQHVDLLFSDIMLGGGIRGDELGHRARALRQGLKVLLTTGYTAERGDTLAEACDYLLRKPFRLDELAEAIRMTLRR